MSLILQSQALWCHWFRRVKLCGVTDTLESSSAVSLIRLDKPCCVSDSADSSSVVSVILVIQALWCHWFRRVELFSVTETAESSSVVSLIPQSQTQLCHYFCRVKLCGVTDSAESSSVVSLIPRSQALQCHWFCGVKLCNVTETTESISAMSLIPWSHTAQCIYILQYTLQYSILQLCLNFRYEYIIMYIYPRNRSYVFKTVNPKFRAEFNITYTFFFWFTEKSGVESSCLAT